MPHYLYIKIVSHVTFIYDKFDKGGVERAHS